MKIEVIIGTAECNSKIMKLSGDLNDRLVG